MTKNDLQGPLKDNEITNLVNLMKNSTTYVNIYTDKYPEGAIRGQINFAEVVLVADYLAQVKGLEGLHQEVQVQEEQPRLQGSTRQDTTTTKHV